jgi:subtilisin family serine protease
LRVQLNVSRVAGTSYSAAEVSGIVALMLQHAPRLSPDKVRNILPSTAQDLGLIASSARAWLTLTAPSAVRTRR